MLNCSVAELRFTKQKTNNMKRVKLLFALFLLLGVGTTVWADKAVISSVRTNMSTYQTYAITNVIDGSTYTKFWSMSGQTTTDYVLADLGEKKTLESIKLYFCSGDQPYGGTVSISSDGSTFTDVKTFTNSELDGSYGFTIETEVAGQEAQYVRFLNTNPNTSSWFQMAEFEVYTIATPERTISVEVSDAEMGKAYIGTEGTTSVTQAGVITLTAVANTGYAFAGWTLNGSTVSTDTELKDNTVGNKHYVANFVLDVHSKFSKPGITAGGNKRAQSQGEILNATGVQDGSTLVFNPTGGTASQTWSNNADLVKVEAGATFDLKVTYGFEGWNDLSVFMLRENGTSSKLYGPYEGSWHTGSTGTSNLFNSIEEAEDMAAADFTAGAITFPITMPNDLVEGEAVLVRFLIHGSDVGDDPSPASVTEGNYCDYLFYTVAAEAPTTYNVTLKDAGTLEDGNSAAATFSADKSVTLPTGVKAYYAANSGKGYVTLTEATGVLPANEGFLLTAASAGTVTLTASDDTPATVTGNLFKATDGTAIGADVNAYVLSKVGDEVCFYLLDATNRTIAAGKAYLCLPTANEMAIKMNFGGEATGIESVETVNTSADAPIFDLSGRRVLNAVKGGVYIQNGKKFIVK